MQVFHKKFQKDIIQKDRPRHREHIPEQLYPAPYGRSGEGDISGQQEPGGESDGENKQKGRYVRAYGYKSKINDLFFKDKIVKNEIKKNIEQQVESAGDCIPESFRRYDLPERRIQPFDKTENGSLQPACAGVFGIFFACHCPGRKSKRFLRMVGFLRKDVWLLSQKKHIALLPF